METEKIRINKKSISEMEKLFYKDINREDCGVEITKIDRKRLFNQNGGPSNIMISTYTVVCTRADNDNYSIGDYENILKLFKIVQTEEFSNISKLKERIKEAGLEAYLKLVL